MARVNLGKVVPQKGVDYMTPQEQAQFESTIVSDVEATLTTFVETQEAEIVSTKNDAITDFNSNATDKTTSFNNNVIAKEAEFEELVNDYVKNTDYATSQKGGVIKSGSNGFNVDSSGITSASEVTYANYSSLSGTSFISKTTLDNVMTAIVGNINSILDDINGEVV